MSKIKSSMRRTNLVLALLTCFLSMFASDNNFIGTYTHEEVEAKLDQLNADVDMKLTPEVKKYLRDYIVSYRHSSETLIGRTLVYFPDIEHKLSEKDLPSEIKFLSVIESSLKPSARSRVGAVGLWQFMKATARMYGLKIDKHVDERKDVEKSTEAALEYLSDLNERFGDWTLALAAYNCGPGNVRKAMRRSGGHDYWTIRDFLPRETRNYVPKFIAIAYLMNYYQDHDLAPNYPDELFIKTRKAKVFENVSFNSISKITGLSLEEIKNHNPSYLGSFIPKNKEGKILELPSENLYAFLNATNSYENLLRDPLEELRLAALASEEKVENREVIEIANLPRSSSLESIELLYVPALIKMDTQKHWMHRKEETPDVKNQHEKRKQRRKNFAAKISATYLMK